MYKLAYDDLKSWKSTLEELIRTTDPDNLRSVFYSGSLSFDFDEHKRQWILETCLRTLKNVYSFVNSICLIILIRPFHTPLINLSKKLHA